ncbi:uncharacterized protein LOC130899130 [Diorhabda carinulata]|uniref:uncharacterized protein LOC130899130 n=1 Tax=Diorhabda carinulata TaxID=1163345 RepID=UPI0025A023D3|nr:uncharacterized protein LOC130899130 [Diorhabda carinulata]
MVDKKRWLNKIHEEPKSSQEYISWSSSDSDNEELFISDINEEDKVSFSSPDKSPIINRVNVEESSPIIGSKRKIEEIRSKFKKSKECPSLTQIIDSESPEFKTTDSGSTTTKNDSGSSGSLYYQPCIKKKRYKKKGLAFLLKKTLDLQKTRLSIWKHELYVKKSCDIVKNVVKFKVIKIRDEYGNLVVECDELYEGSGENLNLVLILINKSVNIDLREGVVYNMYPPYESKIVTYKSEDITCYFNVTRIVK